MAAAYTPTTFTKGGQSTVASTWGRHFELLWGGWTPVGQVPNLLHQEAAVTRAELGEFRTDDDIQTFRQALMDFIVSFVGDIGEGGGTAASTSFDPALARALAGTETGYTDTQAAVDLALTLLSTHWSTINLIFGAVNSHLSSGTHPATSISTNAVSGATNAHAALAALAARPTGMAASETITTAPGSALFKRTLNYPLDVANPNLSEVVIAGVMRSWDNEWGAGRGRNPYPTYADAFQRAVVGQGDYVGTSGGSGAAFEIVDRRTGAPPGAAATLWGRRWSDGSLVRNGHSMTDTYVATGGPGAPLPAGLPRCLVARTTTPVPVV